MSGDYPYDQRSRAEVAAFLPQRSEKLAILEIGCGYGNFRKNLSDSCEYWGVERVASIAQLARNNLDHVLVGTYDEVCADLPNQFFDCVVCNDVIEHMSEVDDFLQSIKTKLKVGGVIIGSIPNVRYIDNLFNLLIRKDWHYVDSGILDRTHLRFFTQKSLQRTFVENGYDIDVFAGINPVNVKTDSVKRCILSVGAVVASFFLGRDTRFTQFGFRINAK